MNASEFSKALAQKVGKDPNSVHIFDRALAEAGARKKARGRHAPPIERREALMLLLAVMSGRPAHCAYESARDLSAFTLEVGQSEKTLEAFHYLFGVKNDFAYLIKKPLLDLLVLLCGRLVDGLIGVDNFVWLKIDDGAFATLQVELNWLPDDRSQRLGLLEEIEFRGAITLPVDETRGNYFTGSTATWSLLRWIGEVTPS